MIGVFDSGVGGLSVHRALVSRLPSADFVYFADQAHTPYGGRSPEEILELTKAGCIRLFEEGASLIVLACNTAASIALRPLQQEWLPEFRKSVSRPVNILGLIVPTIEAATGLPWQQASSTESMPHTEPATLGIFATPATVRSEVYEIEIHKRRPDIKVFAEPCPELARMIEAGADRLQLGTVINDHVQTLRTRIGETPWRAILGCTHYEIVSDLFARALPPGTPLIHQPTATAEALARYIACHPEYDPGNSGLKRFISSKTTPQNKLAEEFWGTSLAFEVPLAA